MGVTADRHLCGVIYGRPHGLVFTIPEVVQHHNFPISDYVSKSIQFSLKAIIKYNIQMGSVNK
jgi:hypothetical protein